LIADPSASISEFEINVESPLSYKAKEEGVPGVLIVLSVLFFGESIF
jgi:hypothetical protein